ncbi:unnamed protein product [Adineta steineri]|uniref:UBC core domain-containing protein n=1 Tax=Adineta steineri TaxID=433720 RepID=A0A814PIJ7_9BILA|nr:unnamed protein product [Adineta steineri]CAF3856190.1 unnamed protein product [Adineta steineri]
MSISFKPQNTKASATKRIIRDLRDLEKCPVPGLAVTCPDASNPFNLHCNVLINDGPYQGIMIHLILRIPEDYPLTGPAGNIAPGLEFNSKYHGHIHEDHRNGHALCNDLLTNYAYFFKSVDNGGAKQASGWSPGYTLSTALLQIVTFFAEPDLHYEPSSASIIHLRNMVKSFQCKTCGHSYDEPIPAIVDYSSTEKVKDEQPTLNNDEEEQKILKAKEEELKLLNELMEKLTCGVTKQNALEDQICLGYPLLIKRDKYGRLWSDIILELISYDAYIAEIQKSGGHKLDFYENSKFRSVTGQDYNHWLPIYININHFQQGQILIQNSISIISNGTALGSEKYDFTPMLALNVLTTLMNKSSVQLFNGQLFESKHAIEAYCHFLRLLMHFIDIYPELDRKINTTIENFITNLSNRNKKVIPDIGEFLIHVALSSKHQFSEIKNYIYEEYFARQVYWIQRNGTTPNLLDIKITDLPNIFQAAKVSNHLLVFNLEMAKTFIFSGVKQHLDRLHGYPPNNIVEKFQQQLKAIKTLDKYSDFIKAIKLDNEIKSPDDMITLITRSVQISNKQGYTNILSIAEQQDRRFDERKRYNQQQQSYNRYDKR